MADRAKHRQNRFLTSDKIFSKYLFWFLSLKWKENASKATMKKYELLCLQSALQYKCKYYTLIVMSKRYER